MRERPIIMNADAVRLIVQGRKTMYRAPVDRRMQLHDLNKIQYYVDGVVDNFGRIFHYPFGNVNDRLWVREPFRIGSVIYKADGESAEPQNMIGGWQPSMYMPRWASRLTLDVIDMRIEPLQSITEADCAAEGSDLFEFPNFWDHKVKDRESKWGMNPNVWAMKLRIIK